MIFWGSAEETCLYGSYCSFQTNVFAEAMNISCGKQKGSKRAHLPISIFIENFWHFNIFSLSII
jgi:hypothetical protein